MSKLPHEYMFLDEDDFDLMFSLGETILGVPRDILGEEFIEEADAFISNLDEFLQDDLGTLLVLFNSRVTSLVMTGSITRFTDKSAEKRTQYFEKWVKSRIGLLRTGASTLKALCGWSYYSLEKSWEELDYPGKTLGREDKTPTLLEGEQPWEEGMEI